MISGFSNHKNDDSCVFMRRKDPDSCKYFICSFLAAFAWAYFFLYLFFEFRQEIPRNVPDIIDVTRGQFPRKKIWEISRRNQAQAASLINCSMMVSRYPLWGQFRREISWKSSEGMDVARHQFRQENPGKFLTEFKNKLWAQESVLGPENIGPEKRFWARQILSACRHFLDTASNPWRS